MADSGLNVQTLLSKTTGVDRLKASIPPSSHSLAVRSARFCLTAEANAQELIPSGNHAPPTVVQLSRNERRQVQSSQGTEEALVLHRVTFDIPLVCFRGKSRSSGPPPADGLFNVSAYSAAPTALHRTDQAVPLSEEA